MTTSGANLKQRLRQGAVTLALRVPITITRAELETALSKNHYDLVYADGQHSAFTDDQLVALSGLVESLGLPFQFRLPHTRHTYLIGRYFDLGPSAILVPEVEEPAVVDEAITYTYYPPVGRRSWGGPARYGINGPAGRAGRTEYAAWWNETAVLAIQLESIVAVEGVRNLAKPGVDFMTFGPNDLTFNLEDNPGYPLRTFDECLRRVVERLEGTGIPLGIAVSLGPAERERYHRLGITCFQENPLP